MKNLTIIPARCGSKRIPGKNIKFLGSKPLLAYSIEYALNHPDLAGQIMVSTDCDRIAEVASRYPVSIHRRPAALAGDDTPTADVLKHILDNTDLSPEFVTLLQPTNPFRPENLWQEAFTALQTSGKKSLFTVTPIVKKLGKIRDHRFVPFNYRFGQRSQDMEPLYYENGMLYISHASMIREAKIMDDQSLAFIINHIFASVDIDTEEDWLYAEFILKKFNL
ncbi:MAG: acylneuraminate cytidylyltransferase family protein [Chlorobi bacterium]|nr:acylneuraminate cytidylyltransferase family protein [Chlorobiota bacterium]